MRLCRAVLAISLRSMFWSRAEANPMTSVTAKLACLATPPMRAVNSTKYGSEAEEL